jgi:hypothetical protein
MEIILSARNDSNSLRYNLSEFLFCYNQGMSYHFKASLGLILLLIGYGLCGGPLADAITDGELKLYLFLTMAAFILGFYLENLKKFKILTK